MDLDVSLTRSDWRDLHIMSNYRFHCAISTSYNNFDIPVLDWFVEHYDQNSIRYWFHREWEYKPYLCIRL